MAEYIIEFFCWNSDDSLKVQLEPEATPFTCPPDGKLKFVAECGEPFLWVVRVEGRTRGVQVFPESKGDYEVSVYLNDELVY